jgi:DNA-directed RNA polymerase specialized sigma subunit
VRFRRRQSRFLYGCGAQYAHQACQDPEQLDPASICIERETQRQLVHSIDLLRTDMGERTHLVVTRYLAGETNLTSLAKTLGISRGRLFHSWRTAVRFLHNDLV